MHYLLAHDEINILYNFTISKAFVYLFGRFIFIYQDIPFVFFLQDHKNQPKDCISRIKHEQYKPFIKAKHKRINNIRK